MLSDLDRQSPPELAAETAQPVFLSGALAQVADELGTPLATAGSDRPKMRIGEMAALFLAQLTLFMAVVVPIAFSLSVKVELLDAASKDTLLALAIGMAGTLALFTDPLVGVHSDRTRSRFGRRLPFGSPLSSLGRGSFGSVDQALALDTLPSEENENGRYLSIYGLANSVPQAVCSFVEGLVLSFASGDPPQPEQPARP